MSGKASTPPLQVRHQTLTLRSPLTAQQVEAWLAEHPGRADDLVVEVPSAGRVALLGDAMLLGLLALASQRGSRVTIRLGPALSGLDEPATSRRTSFLTTSLVGHALGQYADDIITSTREEVSRETRAVQSATLVQTQGLLLSGEAKSAVLDVWPSRYEEPVFDDIWLRSSPDAINSGLMRLLHRGLLGHDRPGSPVRHRQLRQFLLQAMENVVDHGASDEGQASIPGIRYVSFRRPYAADEQFDESGPRRAEGGSPYSDYLDRLSNALRQQPSMRRSQKPNWTLIEVTVGDPGVGVAARMCGDAAVYEGSFDEELAYFAAAFPVTGTSKRGLGRGAGRGLPIMTRAVWQLGGLCVFRSGRIRAFKHFLDEGGSWTLDRFDEKDQAVYSFTDVNDKPLGRIAGTIVTFLVPWGLTPQAN